jgi:hypothetical protein
MLAQAAPEYSFDLQRMFWGEHPPLFLLEVVFRTIVIFVYTLILIRWMGKRGMGQLTPFEFAIIVALGSAVGDPMFQADVPLLHTMLVIALVLGMQKLLVYLTERNTHLERVIESVPRHLVESGVILMDNLHLELLSLDELNERLREHGIRHLGQVATALLEPSGKLSVIRAVTPKPGLAILPIDCSDPEARPVPTLRCCSTCGKMDDSSIPATTPCPNCGEEGWQPAVEVEGDSTRPD